KSRAGSPAATASAKLLLHTALLTSHSWRSYRPLPTRLRPRIKIQTQLYPILQIFIHINPNRIDQKKPLHNLPREVHVTHAWLFQRGFIKVRIDTDHEGIFHYAHRHLIIDHVTQPAHHL